MDLELSDDQQELRDNVRQVLEGASPPELVRAVFEADPEAASRRDALWDQLVELYWPGLGVAEADGGLGLGFVEVGLVAEELGRAVAPVPLLSAATQFAPLVAETAAAEQRARFLGAMCEGTRSTLAVAERNRWDLDAVAAIARPDGDGWLLDGTKTDVVDGASAAEIAVVARAEGSAGSAGLGVFVVPAGDVSITGRTTLDPTLPLADVELGGVRVGVDRVLLAPDATAGADAIERALQHATVAMALTSVGACRKIFEVTLDYAKVRVQYDRVIGSFQALKHRFADLFLAVERATAVCYHAALAIAEDDPVRAEATAMAKSAAGDCQRLLAGDGLQLHGGIGYTWEHDLHFWLKRAKTAGLLFGNAAQHRAVLARRMGLVGEGAA